MGLTEYYLIFVFSTAFFALIDVFMPVLKQARTSGVKNTLTQNPKLSCTVYFFVTAVMAPLVFLPMLVPSMNERFRQSISNVVHEEE